MAVATSSVKSASRSSTRSGSGVPLCHRHADVTPRLALDNDRRTGGGADAHAHARLDRARPPETLRRPRCRMAGPSACARASRPARVLPRPLGTRRRTGSALAPRPRDGHGGSRSQRKIWTSRGRGTRHLAGDAANASAGGAPPATRRDTPERSLCSASTAEAAGTREGSEPDTSRF